MHGGCYAVISNRLPCVAGRMRAEHVLCLLSSISLMFHLFPMTAEVCGSETIKYTEKEINRERE